MNPAYTLIGSGAVFTVLLGVYDRIRNRGFDRRKQNTTIKLDEAQYAEIQARAEQSNSSNLMAVGAFWQGQFMELAKEFDDERDWRRRMTERARAHKRWDDKLMRTMRDRNIPIDEDPPSLDPDDNT